MLSLLLLLLSPIAQAACIFPAQANILKAEAIGTNIALLESQTNCLYAFSPTREQLWAIPLASTPSDFKFHTESQKIFFYFPQPQEIRSIHLPSLTQKVEARFQPKETCTKQRVGDIEAENCTQLESENFRILLGRNEIILTTRGSFLLASLNDFNFRSLRPFNWHFGAEVSFDPISGRVLALRNEPSGESIVSWYILNHKLILLSPLPAVSILSSGLKRLYFFPGGEYFLADNGLIYRTSDLEIAAKIQKFEDAYFAGSKIITVTTAEEGLFKATIHNQHLRPVAFEYFFARPILFTEKFAVLPTGSLQEILRGLP